MALRSAEATLASSTALNPHIGYDAASKNAQHAHARGISLRNEARELDPGSAPDFHRWVRPQDMRGPRQ